MATDIQNREKLPPADQRLLEFFGQRRTAQEIFNLAFPQELESACRRYRQELIQRQILTGSVAPEDPAKPWGKALAILVLLTALILLLYASYVMQSGFPPFLLLGVVVLVDRYFKKDRYKLSDIGERYLNELQLQFRRLEN